MMATTSYLPTNNSRYYMNAETGPSPPESYAHGKTTTYGGALSQTPPSNISPTSMTSGINVRQLRQPRQPMYIPAALRPTDPPIARPTDIPSRPRPLDTPPMSKDNSFDSGKATDSPLDQMSATATEPGAPDDLDDLRRHLSNAASEMLDDTLGEVTGPPTTAHWKPDSSASGCHICAAPFTWYFRRHHCRRCGQLVCETHLTHRVPLDQNARYHPAGTPSKACHACWDGWKLVKKLFHRTLLHSRSSSIAESSNSSQGTALPIPANRSKGPDFRVGSMARSEGGMVWSTF